MGYAYLLLGTVSLAALWLVARWFARADLATLVAAVKWIGGTLAVLLGLYLIFRGQFGVALALTGLALMLWRAGRGRLGRGLGGAFAHLGRVPPSPGQQSTVETPYLHMSLDHDSGGMDGTVRQGPFAGRALSTLGLDELLDLLAECARADEQSAQLIEAYLDRGPHPEWRETMRARGRAATGRGQMTPEEAREVLGVGRDATADEIKEAHRRLMQLHHPDRGGSTYIAAKLNLAKEVLLGG